MAGRKRCVLKGGKGKGKKKRKEKEKGGKNGDQNRFFFFFFFFFFFLSPRAGFFICAVVIFQIYKENCI